MIQKQEEREFTDPDTCDAINEEPLTFKGLTSFEFKACIIGSIFIGVIIGIPLAILFKMPSLPLVTAIVMPLVIIIIVGKKAAEIRRGKPVGFLYQKFRLGLPRVISSRSSDSVICETRCWGLGRNNGRRE